MGTKQNKYLDGSDEEDKAFSDLDDQEEGRTARIRNPSSKRRKLNEDDSEDSQAEQAEQEAANIQTTVAKKEVTDSKETPQQESLQEAKIKSVPGLKLSNAHQRKKKKTGVLYISRIPPFMKPSTLRHLLTPYGTLLRIFLTPEPSPAYQKRVKSGGNKKRSFVDGWVEFESKKKAKTCAETLNGNIMGGKKGGWYHDDIWNIKYLRGFKWDDLMEQVQDEERIRQGRLRVEIQQEAKERKAFLENVEKDKKEKTREAKRRRKLDGGEIAGDDLKAEDLRPIWTQNKVKQSDKKRTAEPLDDVKRVLSKIF